MSPIDSLVPKVVPEDAVEVRPGVTHKYPYHEVEPPRQRYPGERLYLAAKAMQGLLFGTFGFFGLHTMLWLGRALKERGSHD